jgi:hypothetical protein
MWAVYIQALAKHAAGLQEKHPHRLFRLSPASINRRIAAEREVP